MVNLAGIVEELDLTIWGEFHSSFINQALDFVPQLPTVISIMPRAVRMVCAPGPRIIVGWRSLRIRVRSYQRHQIQLQQVLQSLGQRHVELGELPPGLALINPLLWARLWLDLWSGSNLERSILHHTRPLSSWKLISDLVPDLDCLLHVVSLLAKLVDHGFQLFLLPSQTLDKGHLPQHLSPHCIYLSLQMFQSFILTVLGTIPDQSPHEECSQLFLPLG